MVGNERRSHIILLSNTSIIDFNVFNVPGIVVILRFY